MDISIKEYILAIVTIKPEKVQGGGCPVICADNEEELQRVSLLVARILGGLVHDLENGVYFICKH